MAKLSQLGVAMPELLLPRAGTAWETWAVVACDQYTSQPEYWQETERLVGDAPSTLRLMLPEVYLGTDREAALQQSAREHMAKYLDEGLFEAKQGMMLVERTVDDRVRTGLVLAVDLEAYDFSPDSTSLIRATERTIVDRLPPRVAIRREALLEMPHVILLLDDPADRVFSALRQMDLPTVYDFDLMQGGGHVKGCLVDADRADVITDALAELAVGEHPILFAVGDGNHSLATAKRCWEERKAQLPEGAEDPARYALVEVVNLHDAALVFHPIHRVIFADKAEDAYAAVLKALRDAGCAVAEDDSLRHKVPCVVGGAERTISFERGEAALPLTLLQPAIEAAVKAIGATVDYIHGDDTARRLGGRPDALALLLPPMDKAALFPEVNATGPLQLKTFSMGEAHEKRYYLECRRIR